MLRYHLSLTPSIFGIGVAARLLPSLGEPAITPEFILNKYAFHSFKCIDQLENRSSEYSKN